MESTGMIGTDINTKVQELHSKTQRIRENLEGFLSKLQPSSQLKNAPVSMVFLPSANRALDALLSLQMSNGGGLPDLLQKEEIWVHELKSMLERDSVPVEVQ
jgi:hypothetical protein